MTSHTIREIATRLDLPPRDVLDALLASGYQGWIWHEGMRMRRDYLPTFLGLRHHLNPVGELEVDLDDAQVEALARELEVEPGEILFEGVRS